MKMGLGNGKHISEVDSAIVSLSLEIRIIRPAQKCFFNTKPSGLNNTETVICIPWHPMAQHSVHIVTAVQCDSILRNSQDYGLFLTDGRVLLRMAKKWPRWQADFPMGLAPSAVLIQFFCRFGIVHNPR